MSNESIPYWPYKCFGGSRRLEERKAVRIMETSIQPHSLLPKRVSTPE